MSDRIVLRGLRAGNLQSLDLEIQHGCWTAVHGPSGAGKSALLFGTLEPVSRRRFQVLRDPTCLPDGDESWLQALADRVDHLPPVIASAGEVPRGRRRTLLVEALNLWEHLAQAWREHGQYRCVACAQEWQPLQLDLLMGSSQAWPERAKLVVAAEPDQTDVAQLLAAGWTRLLHRGRLIRLEEAGERLPPGAMLLIDRLRWSARQEDRLREALIAAMAQGGPLRVEVDGKALDFAASNRCPSCSQPHSSHGQVDWARRPDVADRVVAGRSLAQWLASPLQHWLEELPEVHAGMVTSRLQLLQRCGLQHLAPDRALATLSLGESRRLEIIAWLSQVRCGQTVLLDEPGMGLHGSERQRLALLLQELVEQGNTVLTADPAREFLEAAHRWLALGPEGGPGGGRIVAQGARESLPPEDWQEDPSTAGKAVRHLEFRDLQTRFLRIPSLRVPMRQLVVFCGVSGSGKSTLLEEELLPRLRTMEQETRELPRDSVHVLLERALSWSARSTIATLSGVWAEVRQAFAESEEGRIRGLTASDLVAQPGQGGCHRCVGRGLDRNHLSCRDCGGLGLRSDLLELRLRNRSLSEWLTTPLVRLEKRLPGRGRLRTTVQRLIALGLGERTLGERGRFLSLGERGRIALARALATAKPGRPKLFLLDEPCLGLPVSEARRVVDLLRSLCAEGHSFWVVEHHEYLLRAADWMFEIGPGAGELGGNLIYAGRPADVDQADTPTGRWLGRRRRREELQSSPPPTLPQIRSQALAEDRSRRGRRRLEQELARELAMRSPLLADALQVDAEAERTVPTNFSEQATDWNPVAWPAEPKPRTGLGAVLGLSAPIEDCLKRHGRAVCSHCGGKGPWAGLGQALEQLRHAEWVFTVPLPRDFVAKQEHPQWLKAAGFRRFLRAGERLRWRRGESEPLKEGDEVWLDHIASDEEESLVPRLLDLQHHARLLGDGVVHVYAADSLQQPLLSFHAQACRDCSRRPAEMQMKLGSMGAEDLVRAPLREVLQQCAKVSEDASCFHRALDLLQGTGLLTCAASRGWRSLTLLQQAVGRVAGWLLFPVPGVALLADQPLSGLPSALARRLGKAMLEGDALFHFTDPDGWCELEEPSGPRRSAVPVEFDLDDWCWPSFAKRQQDLGQALGVWPALFDYFARSEAARTQGWGSLDLDPKRSQLRCAPCKGRGRQELHPQWSLPCPSCGGSGWQGTMAKVEDRGLRWQDLPQRPLHELADFFRDHSRLGRLFELASRLEMGEFCLAEPLLRLPLGVRSLAPWLGWLDGQQKSGAVHRLALTTAGWNRLEAERISRRIEGLGPEVGGLEIRENHPLFLPA